MGIQVNSVSGYSFASASSGTPGPPGPQGPQGPQGPPGPAASLLRTNVIPSGAIDGVNTTFTTPTFFTHNGLNNEMVYRRGMRMMEGPGNDYLAVESGGIGTGYDTIVFAEAPLSGDVLLLDYYPV